jgi:hypothetical protein
MDRARGAAQNRVMPRTLHLDDDGLVLQYSGLLALGTLQRRVRVEWSSIRAVCEGAWPRREAHGRFRRAGLRLFLSFDDPRRVVRLRLAGAPYDEVVIGADDPPALVRQIAARISPAAPALAA